MTKAQLKVLATKIHGLAVKSANGKKTVQNKAIEKIAVLLNQAIEGDVKQAYAGIASQVRGLAEKLEPTPARKAVKRKKVTRGKPVVAKRKTEQRRGRVKPTERVAEQTETTTP
jgi:hypothetical protein